MFGDHYIPHDGDRESLWLEQGTMGVMEGLGFRPLVVERPRVCRSKAAGQIVCRSSIGAMQRRVLLQTSLLTEFRYD